MYEKLSFNQNTFSLFTWVNSVEILEFVENVVLHILQLVLLNISISAPYAIQEDLKQSH